MSAGHYTDIEEQTEEEVHMGTMRSQTAGANTKDCAWQNCRRCNGYMEHEMCIDLESDNGSSTCWVLRCLQCGDIVDETILQHRSLHHAEALCVAAA